MKGNNKNNKNNINNSNNNNSNNSNSNNSNSNKIYVPLGLLAGKLPQVIRRHLIPPHRQGQEGAHIL